MGTAIVFILFGNHTQTVQAWLPGNEQRRRRDAPVYCFCFSSLAAVNDHPFRKPAPALRYVAKPSQAT